MLRDRQTLCPCVLRWTKILSYYLVYASGTQTLRGWKVEREVHSMNGMNTESKFRRKKNCHCNTTKLQILSSVFQSYLHCIDIPATVERFAFVSMIFHQTWIDGKLHNVNIDTWYAELLFTGSFEQVTNLITKGMNIPNTRTIMWFIHKEPSFTTSSFFRIQLVLYFSSFFIRFMKWRFTVFNISWRRKFFMNFIKERKKLWFHHSNDFKNSISIFKKK